MIRRRLQGLYAKFVVDSPRRLQGLYVKFVVDSSRPLQGLYVKFVSYSPAFTRALCKVYE